MIPNTAALCQEQHQENGQKNPLAADWQKALAQAIRDPKELLATLGLRVEQFDHGVISQADFPLRVPRSYVSRMRRGDASDPLLLQVLPQGAETVTAPGYVADPVGEDAATVSPGLLHKYQGRVLLVTTGACPVHCRYCFRRHFPYADNQLDDHAWQQALGHIAADDSIREVILSGGDPLSLSNGRLASISSQLSTIGHLKRLRIHTRMPIVLPERIDDGLLAWLENLPWQTVMVIHCNHANEIDAQLQRALAELKQAGVTLLNQTVLLKNVNNSLSAQADLSEALFASGVLPYYLHQLDRVAGAAHFEVTDTDALRLMDSLQRELPGYLVPRLVRENPGMGYKTPMVPYS